jgi:SAM-dependent methyltransferase
MAMNLIELIKRKDRPLEKSLIDLSGEVTLCNHDCDGFRMRGISMPAGSSVKLHGFLRYGEFKYDLPRDLGWAVSIEKRWFSTPAPMRVVCSVLLSADNRVEVARQTLKDESPRWWPLHFYWPSSIKEFPDAALLIEVGSSNRGNGSDAVVIGITEHFDLRKALFEYTRGKGIEIGPGISPQVLPSKGVQVRYLERSPIEDWERLYNRSGKYTISDAQRKLFPYYIIGNAQRLDVIENESLDFIFSSHVFEHFTNPLGTLEVWQRKLRPGGHVVGVVPEAHNCFDILQPLSKEEQWLEEWTEGVWEYDARHYDKWCHFTQPWASPEHLKKTGFAIHAHYYSPRTFGRLMELAVQRLGYSNSHIRSTRNHKDFGFVLQK